MAERTLAKMVHSFQHSLGEYANGDIETDTLLAHFNSLKTGIANVVSRYCDDFSAIDYYNELTKLHLDSIEESRRAREKEEEAKDD